MTRRLFAAALALMVVLSAAPALAEEIGLENPRLDKDIPIETAPDLLPLGIKATVATLQGEKPGAKETVLIFTTFDNAFTGELQVRGFRSDNVEIARSALKRVNYKANEGGHILFEFDKHTSFRMVTRFTLTGRAKAVGKTEESLGDKISNTARELFQ